LIEKCVERNSHYIVIRSDFIIHYIELRLLEKYPEKITVGCSHLKNARQYCTHLHQLI